MADAMEEAGKKKDEGEELAALSPSGRSHVVYQHGTPITGRTVSARPVMA